MSQYEELRQQDMTYMRLKIAKLQLFMAGDLFKTLSADTKTLVTNELLKMEISLSILVFLE